MRKLSLALLLMLLVAFNNIGFSQEFVPYKTNVIYYNGYSFPVYPKSSAWKDMTHSQRLESLQLPTDTLENISTSRLLETCLYYPFNINVFVNDNVIDGFKKIKSQFNGYEELFGRNDFASELINMYSSRDVDFIRQISNDYDCGQYSFDFMIMELMIYEFLDSVSNSRSNQIANLVSEKKTQREGLKEFYSKNNIAEQIINMANQ